MDIVKVEVIEKLPPPTSVKGIQSFLGHAGFYGRFIKDFSKIAKPLSNLLMQEVVFTFDEQCNQAFMTLKGKLISAPIVVPPDWASSFELMCVMRVTSQWEPYWVRRKTRSSLFRAIYYASRTLISA